MDHPQKNTRHGKQYGFFGGPYWDIWVKRYISWSLVSIQPLAQNCPHAQVLILASLMLTWQSTWQPEEAWWLKVLHPQWLLVGNARPRQEKIHTVVSTSLYIYI